MALWKLNPMDFTKMNPTRQAKIEAAPAQALPPLESYKPNELANRAGVTPSSVYSMLDPRRKEVSVNLVKKLCDGLDMTLGEFFSTQKFDELEQEIK